MLAGFQGIHFQDKVIEFGDHEGLGSSEDELSCSEFGHGVLETVQARFGMC